MSEPSKVSSVEEDLEDPNEVENAWAVAIEQRRREVRAGEVALVDSRDVAERLEAWRPKAP